MRLLSILPGLVCSGFCFMQPHCSGLELQITPEPPTFLPSIKPDLPPSIHSNLCKTKIEPCHPSILKIKSPTLNALHLLPSHSTPRWAKPPSFWTSPLSPSLWGINIFLRLFPPLYIPHPYFLFGGLGLLESPANWQTSSCLNKVKKKKINNTRNNISNRREKRFEIITLCIIVS